MLCLLWMCISQWSCSYYALILWNAKNYNNSININMVSEPTWRKHNLQEEKHHCYRTPKLGFWKSKYFQLPNTLESCALTQGSIWHLESTFLVAGSSGKWNPSFTKVPEVPEAPIQKSIDQIWRGKNLIFSDPRTPGYSPQPSAPPGKVKIWF